MHGGTRPKGRERRGSIMGTGKPFDPRHVPGLALWLRGDWSPFTLNTLNVAQWNDISGNGNHAVQSTEVNQPDYTASASHGRPSVTFDDANSDSLVVSDASGIQNIFAGGGYLIAALLSDNSGGGTFGRVLQKGASDSISMNNGEEIAMRKAFSTNDGIWSSGASSFTFGAWHILEVSYDSDDVANDPSFTIDGAVASVSETSTPVGSATTDVGSDLVIGNRSAGNRGWDGQKSEIALFSETPSTANQSRLRTYMANLYGVTLA